MYNEKMTALIAEAMKSGNKLRLQTLRNIKSAYQLWATEKKNVGKELTAANELQIIRKLVNDYREEAAKYQAEDIKFGKPGEHDELIKDRLMYAEDLEKMLPPAPSEEEILEIYEQVLIDLGLTPEKKNMGAIINAIKEMLPAADGKTVASIVQSKVG